MYVRLSEVTVTDGMIFPTTSKYKILSDIEISSGELYGSPNSLFLGYFLLSEQVG